MMQGVAKQLWADEVGGFLNSAELVILGTVLVLGILPGITSLRDAIVCEMADMAEAINGGKTPPWPRVKPVQGGEGGNQQIAVASDLFGG